jgi:hypothetical protein
VPVTLQKIVLAKSDLDPLSDEARRFLFLACHIADELAILQKILIGCMQTATVSDLGAKAYSTQNLVVAKLIAGKLSEARQALNDYYFSGPSRDFGDALPDEAKTALEQIKVYFRGRNLITSVRNEAAFHYGGDGILPALASVPADHGLLLFVGEHSGNSLYYAAEEVVTFALLDGLGGDAHATFHQFVQDVQVIARAFTTFCEGFFFAALMKVKPDFQLEKVEVDPADTAKLDEQIIKCFLEP